MCSIFKIPVCPLHECLVYWALLASKWCPQCFFHVNVHLCLFQPQRTVILRPGTLCSAREPQISYVFWPVEAAKNANLPLIWWMLRARSIYFKPFIYAAFMIYAEARQPCYSISLLQLFQAYCTLPSIFAQHILIVGYPWFCQTHHEM